MRDHLAFARMDGSGLSPDVVELVYRELGAALALENVTVLEDEGVFDPEYQQVVDLRATADPAQADRVCQTVRAGYSVGGEVVRPQQVVIYARAG
ncbi:nucleotide exchange factor GrpE [Longimicrobium sp.]|uniref:nucleotide exchange factor GrpE n=1 Tax=Longimicrobium sp. TaxID=2029185 RepID=UPI003B3A5D16